MKIVECLHGEHLTLSLSGSFDERNSAEIEDRILDTMSRNIKSVSLDLDQVDYISSVGIGVLIAAYKKSVKSGKRINISSMSDKTREILDKVGVLGFFNEMEKTANAAGIGF